MGISDRQLPPWVHSVIFVMAVLAIGIAWFIGTAVGFLLRIMPLIIAIVVAIWLVRWML